MNATMMDRIDSRQSNIEYRVDLSVANVLFMVLPEHDIREAFNNLDPWMIHA